MSPEERLEKCKTYYERRRDRLKAQPGKWEEFMAHLRNRKKNLMSSGDAERVERMRENRRRSARRYAQNRSRKLRESGLTFWQVRMSQGTPEDREYRLLQERIKSARFKRRKKLPALGVPPEQIQEQLRELEESYRTQPYKSRPRGRRTADLSYRDCSSGGPKDIVTQLAPTADDMESVTSKNCAVHSPNHDFISHDSPPDEKEERPSQENHSSDPAETPPPDPNQPTLTRVTYSAPSPSRNATSDAPEPASFVDLSIGQEDTIGVEVAVESPPPAMEYWVDDDQMSQVKMEF